MSRSRRRVTAEIVRAKQEGKGRKKEWMPRGEPIPPNKIHAPRTGYRRNRNWRDYLNSQELSELEEEEEELI